MKRVFKFKKGEFWDGDEMIIHYLEDLLLTCSDTKGSYPEIEEDMKITIISEKTRKAK